MNHRTLKERESDFMSHKKNGYCWMDANTDAKKTAVIVHGITGSKFDMLPLAEAYVQAGYAVYFPDLPGHGMSDMIPARTFKDLGNWLNGFIEDTLRLTPDVIVSNSFGSAVTYAYVTAGHLDKSTHVILGCPTPHVALITQSLQRINDLTPTRLSWSVYNNAPSQKMRIKVLYRGDTESSYLWLEESERQKKGLVDPGAVRRLSRLLERDNPYLSRVSQDVQEQITVVMGERDNVITRKAIAILDDLLPHARFINAGNVGHILHFEAVDKLIYHQVV